MLFLTIGLFVLSACGVSVGFAGMARGGSNAPGAGARMILLLLPALGVVTVWAAFQPQRVMLYLGLGLGLLVIVSLWEAPKRPAGKSWLAGEV